MPASRTTPPRRSGALLLPGAALVVLALFAWITATSVGEWGRAAADYAYNLQVEGFRAGELSLPKPVPAGLAQLADPYNPEANLVYRMAPYSLHDLSYYRGRLYLYFGVTPALLLFWPWVALTGHFLTHKYAAALCCAGGFLAAAAWLRALWLRYFPSLPASVVAAGLLAVGLAAGAPILLQRADVCEVPISCASMLVMLALGAVWLSAHRPAQRGRWLIAASLAYGLAVGARPSALFGAAILLIPVGLELTGPEPRRIGRVAAAAILPLALCGLGLMLYNALRFGSPLEFGEHYQLASDRQDTAQHFSLRYLWFNFRVYFLAPVRWSGVFPFAREIVAPSRPAGHAPIEDPFGILANIPLAWLALAAPLAWRGRREDERRPLRALILGVALVFGTSAFVLGLFYGNCSRYEFEFLPALILLAVVGILGLERALVSQPGWRQAVRAGWIALLAFSIAFNLLESAEHHVVERYNLGNWLRQLGRNDEAIGAFREAIALRPDYAEAHDNLGSTLLQGGRTEEAATEFQAALRLRPDSAEAHNNLANVLLARGQAAAAIAEYGQAARLDPASAVMRYNLGSALLQAGQAATAVPSYREALRLQPDYPEANDGLGTALAQTGQLAEAEAQYRTALRRRPDFADTHFNLANVLTQLGRPTEAQAEYREAVRLRPELGRARP
jgi:tetratricopeptide (TPR) repeat protein